jgi:hypothetical protein
MLMHIRGKGERKRGREREGVNVGDKDITKKRN